MDPLDQLHDITLAEPISWWPLAIGWWIALVIIVAVIITSSVLYMKKRRQNAGFRAAKKELQLIRNHASSPYETLTQVNALLKRCSRVYTNSEDMNALHGIEWQHYLSTWLPNKHKQLFTQQSEQGFTNLYKVSHGSDLGEVSNQFYNAANLWLNNANPKYHKEVCSV